MEVIIIGVAWLLIHLASKKGARKLSQPSSSYAAKSENYSSPRRDEYRPKSKREKAIVDAVETGATLHFRYTDQDGVITTRSVKPPISSGVTRLKSFVWWRTVILGMTSGLLSCQKFFQLSYSFEISKWAGCRSLQIES